MMMQLTPNRRLALFLQHRHNKILQIDSTHIILPLSTWLENLYSELCVQFPNRFPRKLLPAEERVIWEKIVADSVVGQTLLKSTNTARLARDAWHLSIEWQLLNEDDQKSAASWEAWQTEDTQVFLQWVNDYKVYCTANHCVDSVSFLAPLTQAILQKEIALPNAITLVEFEELSPQILGFLEVLRRMGTTVSFSSQATLTSLTSHAMRFQAIDEEDELRCALQQIKHWLTENPSSHIGLVVPDLEKQRSKVIRMCEEVFSKEVFAKIFNVAAPLPLSHAPLIQSAFLALSVFLADIPLEKCSQFLRCVFFGNVYAENILRAALDVELRQLGEVEFSIEGLLKALTVLMQKKPKLACQSWLQSLQSFVQLRAGCRGKRSPDTWVTFFKNALNTLGWPGTRPLSAEEEMTQLQWEKILSDYIVMTPTLGEHTLGQALQYCQQLANETSLSLLSSPTAFASVQILGMLETLGLPFDYLWVTGMHREAWPLDPTPNPFIPLKLQFVQAIPRSSAQRELVMAKRFTERLSVGPKKVIFSYPAQREEQACKESALISHFPLVSREALGLGIVHSWLERVAEVSKPDKMLNTSIEDFVAPPVGKDEKYRGGTRLLKLQALCPFRAFAEGRLLANPLPVVTKGLSPVERGEILHQILQNFWQDLPNQASLLALSPTALSQRIDSIVEDVFVHWQSIRPTLLSSQYAEIEKQRNIDLLLRWLELEKTRDPFEVVAHEAISIFELQGLAFKIRIDRIDKLENQDEILIDYKTGVVSISHWFGERPRDPQMPFYGLTRAKKPVGLVFASLRKGSLKFQGITQDEKILPGVKSIAAAKSYGAEASFSEQYQTWHASLSALAEEFKQGVATVSPLDGEQTCRTCSLQTLCRVGI